MRKYLKMFIYQRLGKKSWSVHTIKYYITRKTNKLELYSSASINLRKINLGRKSPEV